MSGSPAIRARVTTLPELIDAAAAEIGDREAYVDGERRLTFREWRDAADAVAARLGGLGVEPGDVVALGADTSIDYAVAYAGIVRRGAIATGINPRLGAFEVAAVLERCRPRLLLVDEAFSARADEGPLRGGATASVERLEEITRDTRPRVGPAGRGGGAGPRPDPSAPVCIVWTSGTTGVPKGAWFDHRNLAAAVPAAGAMTVAFDRRLSPLPMAHAGFMTKLWEQLAMGVTIVLAPRPWSADATLDVAAREQITVIAAVPTQWERLVARQRERGVEVARPRIGLSATAPAAPELIARVREVFGCPLVVRYATTESPSITGTDPDDPPDVACLTVGRPQRGVAVDVVDEHGVPVRPGETGRVRVRGDCVTRGYWNDPVATAAAFDASGAFVTGDVGRFDARGNLVLLGRSSDMYIRGGYNVHPLEVERVLQMHPGIAQVAVVGMPAPVLGEVGVAVVVPADPGAPPGLEELRSFVRGRLADYKAPDRVVIRHDLPLTTMAKLDRAALRATLLAETHEAGGRPAATSRRWG